MSKNRFYEITRHLKLSHYTDEDKAADPWIAVRPLIDRFNKERAQHFVPGSDIVIDESFSSWRGKNGAFRKDGMPHVTMEKRKPKGVGLEIRNTACAATMVMLRLELQEGKERMGHKKYSQEFPRTTAQVMRLVDPWAKSFRTIVGDSAFASAVTSHALLSHLQLHFIGCVKRAHKLFPKGYLLEKVARLDRGAHCGATTVYNGVRLMGVAWKDKTLKTYISTKGDMTLGSDLIRKRQRLVVTANGVDEERYERAVSRPAVVESYHSAAAAIGVHNHYRQAGLGLEMSWRTHRWWHRVFATILGIIEVDAYNAYCYFKGKDKREYPHLEFRKVLVASLLQNSYGRRMVQPISPVAPSTPQPRPAKRVATLLEFHSTPKLKHAPPDSNAPKRLRCRVCKVHCTTYCDVCSVPGRFYGLHDSSHPDCYFQHAQRDPTAENSARKRQRLVIGANVWVSDDSETE